MVLLDFTILYKSLKILDESLERLSPGKRWHLICCGGAAMLSLGVQGRRTNDIDLLQPHISEELKAAAEEVHQRLGLSKDWLNDGPKDLVSVLPADWLLFIEQIYPVVPTQSGVLSVSRLGRRDLILTKFLAHVDRGSEKGSADLADLLALDPKRKEIEWSALQIKDYDANPGWNSYVENVLVSVLRRLPNGQ